MKVKYDDRIYCFEGDLDCLFFSNLINEGIEEVELKCYEDIFVKLLNNTLCINKETDYVVLYKGLVYFGSKKERELISFLQNKIYIEEKENIDSEIKQFFKECVEPKISITLNEVEQNHILACPFISHEFLEEHNLLNEKYYRKCVFDNSVPFDFLEKNLDKIDIRHFSRYANIPLDFLESKERSHNRIKWYFLCENKNIPFSFFEKNLDKVSWHSLWSNPNITIEFIEKHLDKINWIYLCTNPSIPVEFLKKHRDKFSWSNIIDNKFNRDNKTKEKMRNTNYFDFEPLNSKIKNI